MGGSSSHHVRYTKEVPGSAVPGSSPIFRHPEARENLESELPSKAQTLYENFITSSKLYGTCPFLGTRQVVDGKLGEYIWKNYAEVREHSKLVGYGLHRLGFTQKDEDGNSFLGIYSKNREEWVVMDLACLSQSITSVPIYDVQQPDTIDWIVSQTGLRVIACPQALLSKLLGIKKTGLIGPLTHVILFEEVSEKSKHEGQEVGVEVISLRHVAELTHKGKDHPPSPDSLFTICYTSGTTGKSKGAMITHRSMIYTIAGARETGIDNTYQDSYLSYLPLAHMLERIVVHKFICEGSSVGFFGGDVMKLKDDLAVLKPTLFVSVPRLYSRFYDIIKQMFAEATGVKGALVRKAMEVKTKNYEEKSVLTDGFWDALVFKKVKAVLGGRVRLMITGSAPIAGDVLKFLRIVFACPILEGYGQTETCAGSVLTNKFDNEIGIIGGPVSTLEVKLMDVTDMDYLSTDRDEQGRSVPRGEICMRGPTVFQGYYKAPEQTAEALDSEGWLHSGDVGMIFPHNGALKIIDRKKNFFKLAQGEYVAAEKIELVYAKSFYISQIFVYGDSFQSYLVAIVVPDEAYVRKAWARENGFSDDSSFHEMCKSKTLKDKILEEMVKRGKEDKLLGFEVVKKIHVESQVWTPEDLLTPTQKIMRFQAKKKYEEVIEELYKESLYVV